MCLVALQRKKKHIYSQGKKRISARIVMFRTPRDSSTISQSRVMDGEPFDIS